MDDEARLRHYDRAHDPTRVLALSDGVFAIVITLLVLEIHVPDLGGGQSLRDALRSIRPSFVAFLISFVVTAIAWAGHRDLFAHIKRTDRSLVWLNILYLLPLSILPFGAALLSRYDDEPVALSLYGILLLTMSLTRLAIWTYATGRTRLLYEPLDAQSRRWGLIFPIVPASMYIVAILVAERAPDLSLLIYFIAPVLYFIGIAIVRTGAPPGTDSDEF